MSLMPPEHAGSLRRLIDQHVAARRTERTQLDGDRYHEHPAKGEPTMFPRDTYTYTDRQAIADGDLIDLPAIGVKVHFNGRLTSIRGKQFEVRRHCGVGRCGPKSAGQRRLRFRGGLDLI